MIAQTPTTDAFVFPMSFAQQRLWFLDQLQPGSALYNLASTIRLRGPLNIDALERSVAAQIERHESLRTTFMLIDDQPVQVVATELSVPIAIVDLQHVPADDRTEIALGEATAELQRPFDLQRGPLLRVMLLRLAPDEHLLIVTMHHIISDGWSLGIFVQELTTLYAAFARRPTLDHSDVLPELAIQYADFTEWQHEWLGASGDVLENQLGYWQRQLADAPALLELPSDRPRGAVQSFRGRTLHFTIDAHTTAQLKQLCQQTGTTLYMALLATFATLLHRYSGQPDLVIGTPIANRNRAEVETVIGFFVNTLALRVRLDHNSTFRSLLDQVRRTTLDAHAHQDIPFEQLVGMLAPERNLSHTPLFQVMFVLQNTPQHSLDVAGLQLTPVDVESETAKFDLTLFVEEAGAELRGAFEYSSDLFDATTIERMIEHFGVLLRSVCAQPSTPVARLPLLPDHERALLLDAWNQTAADYPADTCLHQQFAAQAARTPDAIAVEFRDERLTYAELEARANQLAHHLQTYGVGPDVIVGICMERSLELTIGLLGILKAGGAYLPLDPNYPRERLQFMLDDSQARLLLTSGEGFGAEQIVDLRRDWPIIENLPAVAPPSPVSAENLAYVIYTSGSTGKPKGVMIPHRGVINYLNWALDAYPITEGNGAPVASSLAFDATITALWTPLLAGQKVVLLPEQEEIERLSATLSARQNWSLVKLTPAHLDLLSMLVPAETGEGQARAFVIGGEALLAAHTEFWRTHAPDIRLINEYGPTETVVGCCVYEVPAAAQIQGAVPIGRPIANTQLYILDAQLNPAPIGVAGELYIGGAGVGRGYLNRPGLTAERFVPDPFGQNPGSRLYKTGDLARYLPDGNIEYLGRIDHQVKIRGFRIELGEIEATLLSHPSVAEAAVIVREDARAGEQTTKQLVAYVVKNQEPRTKNQEPASDLPPSPVATEVEADRGSGQGGEGLTSTLRAYLGARLPEYMVPALFVELDALPVTMNGKLDRSTLPAPVAAAPAASGAHAPRTPIETTLAQIWAEVLRLPEVGIHDNFFGLGGDSILSIQVIARARQAGLHLTPKQLFQHQTIAELAAVVTSSTAVAAQQDLVTGSAPLTPIQRWFFEQPLANPQHYNQSLVLRVAPDLDAALVAQALDALVAQHDALRLRFALTPEGWTQTHAPAQRVTCAVVDLRDLPAADREAALTAHATTIQASLDLTNGLLLRAALFHLADDQPARLLLVIHHLVVDGVSWRILLEDFVTAYSQLSTDQTIQLPPKTTSYQRWTEQLVAYAHSSALDKERAYWIAQVAQSIPALPVDNPTGLAHNTVARADTITVALSVDETTALLQQVPNAYQTQINDVLLTALAQTLGAWSNASTVRIDLEGHGREEIDPSLDLTRTVGWFTTIAPVVLPVIAHDPGYALKTIKETLRAIPQHGLGYGLLRYLRSDDKLAGSSAQVSFNYLGQLDQAVSAGPLLGLAPESSGSDHALSNHRPHLLEVTAHVSGDQLHVAWTYSRRIHTETTIKRVADEYQQALRALIAHCQSPEAGGFTPSDFPAARVNAKQLDTLMARLKKGK